MTGQNQRLLIPRSLQTEVASSADTGSDTFWTFLRKWVKGSLMDPSIKRSDENSFKVGGAELTHMSRVVSPGNSSNWKSYDKNVKLDISVIKTQKCKD